MATESVLPVSVVVCTADRGTQVVATIESILTNVYPHFEVVVVDQSSDDVTSIALERFHADHRFHYVRSATKGSGRAHNIGIAHTQSEIVLYTDDDCTVPHDWISVMVDVFRCMPRVAIVFCNVDPAPHDSEKGFIPTYVRSENKLVRNLWDKCNARGIGAGMGIRREAILEIGGFDNSMGPGGKFKGCMDGDLAVRALLHKWWIFETTETSVVHYGFRTWKQGRSLTQRAWYGIGAAYFKPLKAGRIEILPVIFFEAIMIACREPIMRLLRLQKPQGIKQIFHFLHGFIDGFAMPIDHRKIVYEAE